MLLNYYRRQAVAQYAQTCKTKQEDNKMKKLVALAMSLTMAFSLVACGNSDASANAGTDSRSVPEWIRLRMRSVHLRPAVPVPSLLHAQLQHAAFVRLRAPKDIFPDRNYPIQHTSAEMLPPLKVSLFSV